MQGAWETHPWQAHGRLVVSENGHHLVHEDGHEFFWLGDTAWHLARLPMNRVEHYMANRVSKGFNVIQFNISSWGSTDHAGEIAFVGEGPPWPTVILNEAYWSHIDDIVAAARRHGVYMALFCWWGSNAEGVGTQFFADPLMHNYQYGLALGRRYADEPHVIWVGSGEFHNPYWERPLTQRRVEALTRLVEGIREGDTGSHLVTLHAGSHKSSSDEFHDTPWLDFHMIQTHVYADNIDHLVYGDWQLIPPKPTLNGEGWYEGEEELFERKAGVVKTPPASPRQRRYDTGWIQRYQAYWSTFYGGIGYTYGHMNLWTMTDLTTLYTYSERSKKGVLLQSALDAPGSAHLGYLRTLMERVPLHTRVPDPDLLSINTRGSDATLSPDLRCATRAEGGSWAFVYSTRGAVMRVRMHRLADGEARAYWYNPRTGRWHREGVEHEAMTPFTTGIPSGVGATDHHFSPPGGRADGNDWVLMIEVRSPAK